MGMSTRVYGILLKTEKFDRMYFVWKACVAAGVAVPDEVWTFFSGETPDPAGMTIHLTGTGHECCRKWTGQTAEGYEVDTRKLPPGVEIVRFVNSW